MFRGGKLRHRDVINSRTAQRIGVVSDIEIDEESGRITAIIVSRGGVIRRLFGLGEYTVPWQDIIAVSEEFVLVDMHALSVR